MTQDGNSKISTRPVEIVELIQLGRDAFNAYVHNMDTNQIYNT